jgi:spore coat polysaccharide biosynthesis predicted glycosyltransferase SpsG
VYTGGIRKNLIQPVLEILKNIAGIKLHLYGPNNLIVPNLEFIVKHGMVNRDKALEAQETSNILLSMGNKDSAFVPSKIFEYISTRKKIIHFCFSQQDSSIPYYRKYKNCLIVNVNDDLNEKIRNLKEFFAIPEKRITYSELKDTFPECEPQYTYETITDFLRLNK